MFILLFQTSGARVQPICWRDRFETYEAAEQAAQRLVMDRLHRNIEKVEIIEARVQSILERDLPEGEDSYFIAPEVLAQRTQRVPPAPRQTLQRPLVSGPRPLDPWRQATRDDLTEW